MKLTGKAKEEFEKYVGNLDIAPYVVMLDHIPECYLNALIIEFFDSVGFKIIITPTMFIDNWGCDIFGWSDCEFIQLESRIEAQNIAIEKANELHNSENK